MALAPVQGVDCELLELTANSPFPTFYSADAAKDGEGETGPGMQTAYFDSPVSTRRQRGHRSPVGTR